MQDKTYKKEWTVAKGRSQRLIAQAYLEQLRQAGKELPIKVVGRRWLPDWRKIAKETELPSLTIFTGNRGARKLLEKAFRQLKRRTQMSAPSEDQIAEALRERRAEQRSSVAKLDAYASSLEIAGKKFPRYRGNPFVVDIRRIATAADIPEDWFLYKHGAGWKQLNGHIERIGIDTTGLLKSKEVPRSYGELLAFGERTRRAELASLAAAEGVLRRENDTRQLANTIWHLKEFCRTHKTRLEDQIGPELAEGLETAITLSCNSGEIAATTRSKHRTEMRRWAGYWRKMRVIDDLPSEGIDALLHLMLAQDVDVAMIGREMGFSKSEMENIRRWLDRTRTPNLYQTPTLHRLEEYFGLDRGTLVSRVAFNLTVNKALSPSLFPSDFSKWHRAQVRRYLPHDFSELPEERRHEIARDLLTRSRATENPWRQKLRKYHSSPFRAKWTEGGIITTSQHACGPDVRFTRLTEQFLEYAEFKLSTRPPISDLTGREMRRGQSWKPETEKLFRAKLLSIFGAAALPLERGGLALPPPAATLALLTCPRFVRWFLEWSEARQGGPSNKELGINEVLAELMNPKTGWLVQRPDLARTIPTLPYPGKPGRFLVSEDVVTEANRDWSAWCALTHATANGRIKELKLNPHPKERDPFRPIMPILLSDNPLGIVSELTVRLREELPNREMHPILWARALQRILIWDVLLETRLRVRNLAEISLNSNAENRISRDESGYHITIAPAQFKNSRSKFYQRHGTISPVTWDLDPVLTPWLDAFLEDARPLLLDNRQSDRLWVKRVRTRRDTSAALSEVLVSKLIRKMSERLAYNPITGTGIPGVEAFAPHAFRDIAATHVLRRGGTLEEAAAMLCDSVAVVRKHYAMFTASDEIARINRYSREARPQLPTLVRPAA